MTPMVDCLMYEIHMQGIDSRVEETTLPRVSDMESQLTSGLFCPTCTHRQRDRNETSLNGDLHVHQERMEDIG